jgi:hypothetical protein
LIGWLVQLFNWFDWLVGYWLNAFVSLALIGGMGEIIQGIKNTGIPVYLSTIASSNP